MKFLLVCSAGPLHEFRLPELASIADLFNFPISYDDAARDSTRPYIIVDLPSEKEARLLGSRAVSVKHIWEYWAHADTYEQLHAEIVEPEVKALWQPLADSRSTSWKFLVSAHGRTVPLPVQREVIETFDYMAFLGDIDLKKPDVTIGVFEEYIGGEARQDRGRKLGECRSVWMGRKICDTQRHMMDVFDLKKRAYIGTTSMESEVSLLMANQAQAAPGKVCYDPFAGTGSMLLTSSAFGAYSFGSDIDGRQMRGKKTSIRNSAEQYNIAPLILDCCSFDLTQHPFRTGELFDAIVTDPPYGVRAGAKRLGRAEGRRAVEPTIVKGREEEGFHHQLKDYVPPSVPWEMTSVIDNLLTFSLFLLKPGGRLVFFLPTNNEEYRDVDIPSIPGLRLVSNSSQDFGKWARRLITMVKEPTGWEGVVEGLDRGVQRDGMDTLDERLEKMKLEVEGEEGGAAASRRPGHAGFRAWYFEQAEEKRASKKETRRDAESRDER